MYSADVWLACGRLYAMGVITTKKSLVQLEKLSTASFCRRRLSVVLVRLKMSETMKEACQFIEQVISGAPCQNLPHVHEQEPQVSRCRRVVPQQLDWLLQGHIRVGPETVTDPAFLVTRSMEDFVTWVDTSKIKRKVLKYSDKLDDYLLLQ